MLSVIGTSIEYCVFLFLNFDAQTLRFQNRYTNVFVVFVKKCVVNGAFLSNLLTDVQADIKFNYVTTHEQSLF